jgi:hypothetical protein
MHLEHVVCMQERQAVRFKTGKPVLVNGQVQQGHVGDIVVLDKLLSINNYVYLCVLLKSWYI